MARIFKRKRTVEIPNGATIIERAGKRYAQYRDSDGKQHKDPITASGRIVVDSRTYSCEYVDADDILRTVRTGCTDKDAATAILNERLKQVELLKAGVITAKDIERAGANTVPITRHIANYAEWQLRTDKTPQHATTTETYLSKLADSNGWRKLSDMTRDGLERAMRAAQDEGKSARTANAIRESAVAFGNWAISQRLMATNPFNGIPKANQAADPRRQRRALSREELTTLLDATERRPLQDALHGNRGDDAAKLSPRTIERLQRTGRERRLYYWLLATTGLRVNEARSLRLADVDLSSTPARVHLRASTTKNGQNDTLPLHDDLAAALRIWIADRVQWQRENSLASRKPIPFKLSDDDMLFHVPEKMVKVFNLDLALAGIPKRDARGRTLDLHALRHTFGTMLAKSGASIQVAQRAMRHSDPKLTANIYTHLGLLDVSGAIQALPMFNSVEKKEAVLVAHQVQTPLTGNLTGTRGKPCTKTAIIGNDTVDRGGSIGEKKNPENVKKINVSGGNSNGVPGGTRTPNPLVRSQVLYPIELRVRSALSPNTLAYWGRRFQVVCVTWQPGVRCVFVVRAKESLISLRRNRQGSPTVLDVREMSVRVDRT